MDKIPQECRDMIGSFLRKQDRSNLTLASKTFYHYFSSANWRSIGLRGKPEELYRTLGFFLDEKYTTKHSLIRNVEISILTAPLGVETPAGLTKRLADSLSRMTCAVIISLHMFCDSDGLDLAEFTRGMVAAPRWEKAELLWLDCDEGIAAATLDRCETDALKHVTMTTWCLHGPDDDLPYRALKSRYLAQPHSLTSLGVYFPLQEDDNGIWELMHELIAGLQQVINDFPSLNHLSIGNETSEHNSPTFNNSSYQEFEDELEELYKALNNSNIEEFSIEISAALVDRDFIARGLQEILPDDYADYFDTGDYLVDTDDGFGVAIDNWFFQLTKGIGTACRHLDTVTIYYRFGDAAVCSNLFDGGPPATYIHRGRLEIWPGEEGLCE
ncbi:hypothetical protein NW768_006568 [Fusarium equiseti]|uniref:F-box domain-containing protein n=1 Tax=Fusarium equiseti TaxID=61235 RepID=A0ABQ8RBW7_FUSEQ|nr:hypothetical protein NW768_006568 [Fusarium equiseti]